MKKKQFRIVTFNRGFITLYKTQVKTWWRWRNFWASNEGNINYFYFPDTDISDCKRYIENYRKAKGLAYDQISISEINLTK